MYLSLCTRLLLNSFLIKSFIPYIRIFFSSFSSLTKRFMHLLFLSKCLKYTFIWANFMHNGDGKALPSCLYPIKYLNKSLLNVFLSDNVVSLNRYFIYIKSFLFYFFGLTVFFFYILLVFISSLQTYYDIYSFSILSFYFFLLHMHFYIYLLLTVLIIFYPFLFSIHLCFLDDKFS